MVGHERDGNKDNTRAPRNSSAPPPACCARSPSSPTCRSRSSPAPPACPASARGCRCRRAPCRRRRWRGCAAQSDAIALRLRHHDDARARRTHAGAARGQGRLRRAGAGPRRGRRRPPHGRRARQSARQAGGGMRGRRLRPHDPEGPVADRQGAGPAGARADVRRDRRPRRRSASWTCGATRWATPPTPRWPR